MNVAFKKLTVAVALADLQSRRVGWPPRRGPPPAGAGVMAELGLPSRRLSPSPPACWAPSLSARSPPARPVNLPSTSGSSTRRTAR